MSKAAKIPVTNYDYASRILTSPENYRQNKITPLHPYTGLVELMHTVGLNPQINLVAVFELVVGVDRRHRESPAGREINERLIAERLDDLHIHRERVRVV